MSGKEHYEKLALKWLEGTITESEKAEFTEWYNSYEDDKSFLPASFAQSEQDLEGRIFNKVRELIKQPEYSSSKKRKMFRAKTIAAAAILLFCSSLGLYWWHQRAYDQNNASQLVHDVQPGGNRATITLSDGQTVELSETQEGIILADGKIRYDDGSQLVSVSPDQDPQAIPFITMTTPKGGRYRITLPDGTAVWLNSASTLRYPARFIAGKRVVELEGEGYFDVSSDKLHPFVVKCRGQEVEVLGTAFNVNSYTDEEGIKTTLVQGKVRLSTDNADSKSQILEPGQQALLQAADFVVTAVNTEEVTAWKEGYFQFNNTDLRTAMKQFARWYDIEVSYENMHGNPTYGGKVPMGLTLNSVLKILRKTGVDFEIKEGRRLLIKGEKQKIK